MRDAFAFILVLLTGPVLLAAYLGMFWPVGLWLVATVLTIALPRPWSRRHG